MWRSPAIQREFPCCLCTAGREVAPGAADRCFFDPDKYRIILFDQRGAGQSTPHAELEEQQHLLRWSRILKPFAIALKVLIAGWYFGGSWGSTLGLAYAAAPILQLVRGLILRGISFCAATKISTGSISRVPAMCFPDYWQQYLQVIPAPGARRYARQPFIARLTGDNEIERMAAAKAWSIWEGRCCHTACQ